MKNYDERIESIFRKYNEKINAKKHKKAIIRRTIYQVSSACAVIIILFFAMKLSDNTSLKETEIFVESTIPSTTTITTAQNNDPVRTTYDISQITTTVHTSIVTTRLSDMTTTSTQPHGSRTTYTAKTNLITTELTTVAVSSTQLTSTAVTETTTSVAPHGDISENCYLKYDDNKYIFASKQSNGINLDEFIGTAEVNDRSGGNETLSVYTYKIEDIITDYAVAAQMNGDTDVYIFINSSYSPSTMQALFNDIGLEKQWSCVRGEYRNEVFEDISDKTFFDKLTSVNDTEPVRYVSVGKTEMLIHIENKLLGIMDTSIAITEKGYLMYNQTGQSYIFFIGTDEVYDMIDTLKGRDDDVQ